MSKGSAWRRIIRWGGEIPFLENNLAGMYSVASRPEYADDPDFAWSIKRAEQQLENAKKRLRRAVEDYGKAKS